tara:strand:- start:940 stop:1776 length:837 start_codon:yes stop_codon:yes gene_type:complete
MINFIKSETPIQICDIGASPIDKTDFIEELLINTNSNLIGFEPNNNEFRKLDKNNPKKKYYNFGIGDGTEKILNVCKAAGMSSFLKPNLNYLKNFYGFEEWSEIINEIKVRTKKLTDIKDKIDFLKIDVQGYESEVIKYGKDKIKNCLVVQLELSPTPLYKDEATFASTIVQLEKLGFSLHMFNNVNTRSFKPTIISKNPYVGLHHLFQIDCVLIKNLKIIDSYNTDNLKKLILILFHSFKSYDLVDYLIRLLDKKTNIKNINKFRNILSHTKIAKKY